MDYLLGFLNLVIVILTLFLIILILIQRGKGGARRRLRRDGRLGAAFGRRGTGDVFTKITVGVAVAWILLSMLMVILTNRKPASDWNDSGVVASRKTRAYFRR